jgi:hypothetical protein
MLKNKTICTHRNVCLGDYTNTFVEHIIDIFDVQDNSGMEEEEEVTEIAVNSSEDNAKTTAATTADGAANTAESPTEIDFDALKSLSSEGIDMSFLPSLQARLAAASSGQGSASAAAADTTAEPTTLLRYRYRYFL